MNFNIFSPKGEIDRSTFVIYYIPFDCSLFYYWMAYFSIVFEI